MELAVILFGIMCALASVRSNYVTNHLAHFVDRLFRF